MKIKVVKFLAKPFVEIAFDEENGTKLLGVPHDHGGSGHTRYYVISEVDFERSLAAGEVFNGVHVGALYYSDFAG